MAHEEETGALLIRRLMSLPYYLGEILSSILIFFLYVVLAKWSYYFVIPPNTSAIFWLPSGISAALFIRARRIPRIWPFWCGALFTAQFYVLTLNNVPQPTKFIWSLANIILPLIIAFYSRKLIKGVFDFRKLRDVIVFVVILLLSVIPTALLAGFGFTLGFPGSNYLASSFSWGASDFMGILFLAPLFLSWSTKFVEPYNPLKGEGVLFFLLLSASVIAFYQTELTALNLSYFSYLIFFVAWAAIRFGARGTTLSLLIIDLLGVHVAKTENLLTLQLLVANIALLMLILAAAIEEHRTERLKAELATKMRDDFISIAAHELKTPLSSLMLHVQMLNRYIASDRISELSVDKVQHLTTVTDTQIKRFSYLINNLLDVTRINAGKLKLHLEDVDILKIINDTIAHFQSEIESSGCKVNFKSEEKIIGHWDKVRIEQVMNNLLSNAIKYGAGKPIEFLAEQVDDKVIFSVRDYGIGISKEHHEKIFDRFERAVPFENVSGLGLGLFISREIIEAHGGSIRVESEKGEGAHFIVELPLKTSVSTN